MGLFDGTPLERPVTCEVCDRPLDACTCPRDGTGRVALPSGQRARVHREKRRGAWVTVVTGLDPVASDRKALLKAAKSRVAAGGSTTEDGFEVQGDHCASIIAMLADLGYPVKRAG
ncbi:MAG: translation initiation factor, partial [Phycisphaerales bacterium]|nr:translation initiation factor [Phycisphaerales bacterium]